MNGSDWIRSDGYWQRGEAYYAVIDTDDGRWWTVQRFSRAGLRLTSTWVFLSQDEALREEAFQRYMDRMDYDKRRNGRP